MTRAEMIRVAADAVEWEFRFENGADASSGEGACDVEITFPSRFETPPASSRLTGSFSCLVEPTGEIALTRLEGELSSFRLPLVADGEIHLHPTGRLELSLDWTPLPGASTSPRHLPPPNRGFVDFETGLTQLTWRVVAHSPELARVGFAPIDVIVSESGHLDFETFAWSCAGIGKIVGGELWGTRIDIWNRMRGAARVRLELPSRLPRDGEALMRLDYGTNVSPGRPQPELDAAFQLSASVLSSDGEVELESSSIRIAAGRAVAPVRLRTRGLPSGAVVQIHVRGAGHSRVVSAVAGD